MKVKCIKNSYIDRNNFEYHYDNETFGELIIGNTYTVVKKYDNEDTYVIKEIARFVPASLFMTIDKWRDQQLNKIL